MKVLKLSSVLVTLWVAVWVMLVFGGCVPDDNKTETTSDLVAVVRSAAEPTGLKYEIRHEFNTKSIVTVVTNNSNVPYEFVVMQLCLYDKDNVRAGVRSSLFGDLTPGEVWKVLTDSVPDSIVKVDMCVLYAQEYNVPQPPQPITPQPEKVGQTIQQESSGVNSPNIHGVKGGVVINNK